jgi:predicted small secreted protein
VNTFVETKPQNLVTMKTFLVMLFLAAAVTAFSGCRTAHGFGEDMEKAGEKIKDKTDK